MKEFLIMEGNKMVLWIEKAHRMGQQENLSLLKFSKILGKEYYVHDNGNRRGSSQTSNHGRASRIANIRCQKMAFLFIHINIFKRKIGNEKIKDHLTHIVNLLYNHVHYSHILVCVKLKFCKL